MQSYKVLVTRAGLGLRWPRRVPTRRRGPRGSPEEITPELQLQPSCVTRLRVTLTGATASRKAVQVAFINSAALAASVPVRLEGPEPDWPGPLG